MHHLPDLEIIYPTGKTHIYLSDKIRAPAYEKAVELEASAFLMTTYAQFECGEIHYDANPGDIVVILQMGHEKTTCLIDAGTARCPNKKE